MKLFRVEAGVANVGPGQDLLLKAAQIKRRLHNLEVIEVDPNTGDGLVRARTALQFKVGEIVGMPDLPRNLIDIVVPVHKSETELEKLAVGKSADRAKEKRDADRRAVESSGKGARR